MKTIKRLSIAITIISIVTVISLFLLKSRIESSIVSKFNKIATEHLGYEFKFSKINYDQISNEIRIENFVAHNNSASAKILVDTLVVEIDLSDILLNKITFNSINLYNTSIYLGNNKKLFSEKQKEEKLLKNELINFSIKSFNVNNCELHYISQNDTLTSPKVSFSLFNLTNSYLAKNLQTSNDNSFEFNIKDETGLRIEWIGNSSNFNYSTGILKVSNLHVDSIPNLEFIEEFIPNNLTIYKTIKTELEKYDFKAKIDFSTVYEASIKDSLFLNLRKSRVKLSSVKMVSDSISIGVDEVLLDGINLLTNNKKASVESIYIIKPKINLSEKQLDISLMDSVFVALENLKPKDWKISNENLFVNGFLFNSDNELFNKIFSENINIKLTDSLINLSGDFIYKDSVLLNLSMQRDLDSTIAIVQIPSVDIKNIVDKKMIEKYSKTLNFAGRMDGVCVVKVSNSCRKLDDIKATGNFLIKDLVLFGKENELLRSKLTEIFGLEINTSALKIDSIVLDTSFTKVTITKKPKSIYSILNLNYKSVINEPIFSNLKIGKTKLKNSAFFVSDPTAFSNNGIFVDSVFADFGELKKDSFTPINIKGWFDGNSNLQILGKMSVFSTNPILNLEANLYNLELSTFQHESFYYGGYEILKGLADLRAFYSPNRDGSMSRKVAVSVVKMKVGDEVFQNDIDLPIAMGAPMLSDDNGDLDFKFKIINKLENTDIQTVDYIGEAISNSIIKAFKKIGNIFSSKKAPIVILFEKDVFEVTASQQKQLNKIADYMLKNTKEKANIFGNYNIELDKTDDYELFLYKIIAKINNIPIQNINKQTLTTKYKKEFLNYYAKSCKISSDENRKLSSQKLEKIYDNFIKSKDLKNSYATNIAMQRAKIIKTYLVKKCGLRASRLFINRCTPQTNNNKTSVFIEYF